MKVFPLETMNLQEAKSAQFRLVDTIAKHFSGNEFFSAGDVGLTPEFHKPEYTHKVESVLADYFSCESAALVRGAGTGAITNMLRAVVRCGDTIIVHKAPVYPTTKTVFDSMDLRTVEVDFHDKSALETLLKTGGAKALLVQIARQKPDDSYDYKDVIRLAKKINPDLPVITDDNYVVMKVPQIGVEAGADLSSFSLFKLLGPQGVGCVAGKKKFIDIINKNNYSGGCQVQGFEAMDALRSLVYAPVALAIQAETTIELRDRLLKGEVPEVTGAFIVNAQSRVVLVELAGVNAKDVIAHANSFGAAIYPVGAESRYEVLPLFYKVSGTFLADKPDLINTTIRINPMRAGADTIIRILRESIAKAKH